MPLAVSDPILTAGYVDYAEVRLCEARPLAMLANSFREYSPDLPTAAIEHRLGDGVATLVTSYNYPGNPAAMPLYRVMVREFVTASARTADIKVLSTDKLRYTVYPDGKMYLLNADYDLPISVKITHDAKEITLTLEPLELKIIKL